MLVLIEANENCPEGGSWRFNAIEPSRPVARIRLYERLSQGEWFQVIGWTGRPDQPICPAVAQKIDDSGLGVAYLVTGGDCGVRLKPADDPEPWSTEDRRQWGAPYVVVASSKDLITGPHKEERT